MGSNTEKAVHATACPSDVLPGLVEDTTLPLDPALEKHTLRKFDKYLLPPLIVILLLAYLDRSNLGMLRCFPETSAH